MDDTLLARSPMYVATAAVMYLYASKNITIEEEEAQSLDKYRLNTCAFDHSMEHTTV